MKLYFPVTQATLNILGDRKYEGVSAEDIRILVDYLPLLCIPENGRSLERLISEKPHLLGCLEGVTSGRISDLAVANMRQSVKTCSPALSYPLLKQLLPSVLDVEITDDSGTATFTPLLLVDYLQAALDAGEISPTNLEVIQQTLKSDTLTGVTFGDLLSSVIY